MHSSLLYKSFKLWVWPYSQPLKRHTILPNVTCEAINLWHLRPQWQSTYCVGRTLWPLYRFVCSPNTKFITVRYFRVHILLLLLRWAPRALEGGPSEHQHLLRIGREDLDWGWLDYRRYVGRGHRGSGISAVNVPLFADPPFIVGMKTVISKFYNIISRPTSGFKSLASTLCSHESPLSTHPPLIIKCD